LNGTKIQLTDVVSLESKIEDSALVQPGDFFFDKKFLRLLVLAGGGSLLSVGRCIKEGKSETTAESFWNGLAAQNGPRRFESLPPKSRIVVAVSGSGRTLENLLSSQGEFGFQIVGVISSRSCRGEEIASSHNIPVFRFDANSDALKSWLLESSKPDLIVLAGYLKIFPVFDEFRGRIFNIHPSLLPKFGGKGFFGHNVHEAVLASGESYSGASVHLVDEVYDRGAVVSQSKVKVSPTDTAETLAAKVFAVEKNLLPRTLADIIQGNIRPPYSKVKVYRF
jgi:phosphoribosylglycinamide formyltransferase-1